MGRNGTPIEVARAAVSALIKQKLEYLVPMSVVFATAYLGLMTLAGFAKGVLGIKVFGAVNLGFVLIALNYLLSWLLAILYGFIARTRFDPLAAGAAFDASEQR